LFNFVNKILVAFTEIINNEKKIFSQVIKEQQLCEFNPNNKHLAKKELTGLVKIYSNKNNYEEDPYEYVEKKTIATQTPHLPNYATSINKKLFDKFGQLID
jgi:hypothetical protein